MPDPRFDVTTFGEMMLRLSVPSGERLETATRLDVYPAGAESNVISLLARLGRRTCWFGALPSSPLGRLAGNALRTAGVDESGITWCEGGRMGTYYIEFGAPPRGTQAIYDRTDSCTSRMQPGQIDWDALLDTRLLHLTGITPAISPSCREIIGEALRRAREKDLPVSFDVNYRQKLWPEAEAAETLSALMQGVELLLCSAADAGRLFGCQGDAQEVAEALLSRSHARHVAVTFGEQGALLWTGSPWLHAPARPTQIVDRLGAGDALAAGLIHGWLESSPASGLRYGVTLAAMALSQHGDMLVTDLEELKRVSTASATLTR
jgi:2-dehydro-3-deoxygluconokinase